MSMNLRERFHEVMNFNTSVPAMKWEFGLWGETLNRWYDQGLPKKNPPVIEKEITTPTASLYTRAWTSGGIERLPRGIAVMAGGLYWPTQGFPLDGDVRGHFKMDSTQVMVDVNLLFSPLFEITVHEETDQRMLYTDMDGVKRIFLKDEATIPTSVEWPITDRASWEKLKSERLRPDDIAARFPKNWNKLLWEYRNRDYPLALGGYPQGFFGTLAHLIGYEKLFYWYCLDAKLVHDILSTFCNLWIAVYEEILAQVEVDHVHFWEDISAGKGSMISNAMVKEFLLPYYVKIIDFLKARGVKIFLVDTDGDCNELIPLFMSAGVTGMYPFETHCGMDIVKVRQKYPKLQMCGGISKSEIVKGKNRIDAILKPVEEVLRTGGYIPFADHFVPPDVSWKDFSYYRTRLNDLIDVTAGRAKK
jgi:uroporphyrinogen-III decarboxylase